MAQTPLERFAGLDDDPEQWKSAFNAVIGATALGAHAATLRSIDDDSIAIEMPIEDHARQPFGLLHGGMSMLLAESAASMHACWGIDLRERVPVGVEIGGSHLASAADGHVVCRATVIRRGRTLIRHRFEVVHVESGRLLCEGRVTNLYKRTPTPTSS